MVQERKSRKLKIIELIGSFTLAGAEIFAADLSKEFLKRGHDVRLISIFPSGEEEKYFARVGNEAKVISTTLTEKKFRSGISAVFQTLKTKKKLEEIIREFHPDVVHTHTTYPDLLGKLLKKKFPTLKVVRTIHTTYDRFGKIRRLAMVMEEKILPQEDEIVFISKEVKRAFHKFLGREAEKETVIYDGIRTEKFRLNKVRKESKRITLLAMGRFIREKGFDLLIRSLHNIETNKKLVLKIAGDGPLKNDLIQLSKQYSKNNVKIDFIGNVSDVPRFLNEGDISVIPSIYEGFGMALIEAMAAGKPLIVSDISTFREILAIDQIQTITDHFMKIPQGLMFKSGNTTSLSQAIEWMMNHKEEWLSFSREALSRSTFFDIGSIMIEYEKAFIQ